MSEGGVLSAARVDVSAGLRTIRAVVGVSGVGGVLWGEYILIMDSWVGLLVDHLEGTQIRPSSV